MSTLPQRLASLAASRRDSEPKAALQHPEAPRIPGYVLTQWLGRGAFGEVWKSWQVRTGKWVAVKIFLRAGSMDCLHLQRELERLIRLDKHPHIVSLLDADLAGPFPYFVMDLMSGGSLDAFVESGCRAPTASAACWLGEIASALAYVHCKGILHCDLKPANILLDEEGHARVADFGQSWLLCESASSLGTLHYMAPEQAVIPDEGGPVVPDVRWDLYGLGTTMHAILSGRLPYGAARGRLEALGSLSEMLRAYREEIFSSPLTPLRKIDPAIDEDLSAIVEHCVEARPQRRYGCAAQVLSDLGARSQLRPISPLAHRRGYRLRRLLRRNRALAGVCALAGLALAWSAGLVLRERSSLRQQMALSTSVEARRHARDGDGATAALYFLESQRLAPSRLALANAQAFVSGLRIPEAIFPGRDSAAMDEAGRRVLTAGHDGTARLWEAADGEAAGPPLRHGGPRLALALSGDGSAALTGGEDGRARLWDAKAGRVRREFVHAGPVLAVGISPDGRRVLTASADRTARLWDAANGLPVGAVMRHPGEVFAVAFSPDGRRLLTGSADGGARLWEARTGRLLAGPFPHRDHVHSVAISPDGSLALTGGDEPLLRLWSIKTGRLLGSVELRGPARSVAFRPDGSIFAAACRDGTVGFWETASRRPAAESLQHGDDVRSVSFSADGLRLLTNTREGPARLWGDPAARRAPREFRHDGPVTVLATRPDGRWIVTGGKDRTARIWDARGLRPPVPLRHPGTIFAAQFSPDGLLAATAGEGGARLWDGRTGEGRGPRLAHRGHALALAFSPGGGELAMGGEDGAIKLWRTGGGRLRTMRELGRPITALAFSPDGRWLLVGVGRWEGGRTLLLDSRSLEPAPVRFEYEAAMVSASFDPGRNLAVTLAMDRVVRTWDTRTWRPTGRAVGYGDLVQQAVLHPQGEVLLTTGMSGNVWLWDLETGEAIGRPWRHVDRVAGAAFANAGRAVVTAAADGSVRLWELPWGYPPETMERMQLAAEVAGRQRLDGFNRREPIPVAEWAAMFRRLRDARRLEARRPRPKY